MMKTDTDMISARYHAQEIANRMTAAYYLKAQSEGGDDANYHVGLAEKDLSHLADLMGFAIVSKADNTASKAAYRADMEREERA